MAVVQGGTQGMGRAAAECFAADGANVAVIARTEKPWAAPRPDYMTGANVNVDGGSDFT
jgi:NAD(P)-dependent dehydrogenase (short-subunit alcohol dehydrogenase family)